MDVKIILKNSSTTKVSKHTSSGFSMSRILPFRSIEHKNDVCRGKDCMKRFCESLKLIFKKKKKVIIKRVAGIKWKSKNMLYLSKENWKLIFERQNIS